MSDEIPDLCGMWVGAIVQIFIVAALAAWGSRVAARPAWALYLGALVTFIVGSFPRPATS